MDRRLTAFYNREHVLTQAKQLLAVGVENHCGVPASAVAVCIKASDKSHDNVDCDCMVDPEQLGEDQGMPTKAELQAVCDVVAKKTEAALRGLGARWTAHGR